MANFSNCNIDNCYAHNFKHKMHNQKLKTKMETVRTCQIFKCLIKQTTLVYLVVVLLIKNHLKIIAKLLIVTLN